MAGLRVNIAQKKNFTPEQAVKYDLAAKYLEYVVNSVEFRTVLLSKTFTSCNGMTSIQVYAKFMTGAETLTPDPDGEIDVMVEMYRSSGSVIGYTNPGTLWMWLNQKFFDQFDYAEVAMNIFHEWLHKVGFDHTSAKDINSVPYASGYMIRDLVHDVMKGRVLTPITGELEVPAPLPVAHKTYKCGWTWRYIIPRKVCWYE